VHTGVLEIVHNRAIDALRRSMVHGRRRASDEGVGERLDYGERTDVEAGRRDEAREVRRGVRGLEAVLVTPEPRAGAGAPIRPPVIIAEPA
jgi:RNA polymerase sigma-70 factor (ECF subfamily)